MGPTGTGKTSLIATLAEYVWATHGKVTLYYSSDGGGFPTIVQALINRGIVRLWRLRTRGLSFETTYRASQGWWPSRIDPQSGETEAGVRLVPPMTQVFVMRCAAGHELRRVPFQAMLLPVFCPQCQQQITLQTAQVSQSAHRTKGFELVGAVAYDSLSSMSNWWQHDLQQKQGSLELKGEASAIGGIVQSGDMKFGGGNRAQVGFAQTRAEELALNALGIPGLVVPPIFTSLTLETSDEGGLPIRGPKLAGRAKTDEAPQWFGNCLETMVKKNEDGQDVYRLNLVEYVDEQGLRHLCKNRAAPGTMPAYLEDAAGQPFSQFNLGVFFRLLEVALQKTEAEIAAKYPNAPGLAAGMAEYGEGATAGSAAPTAPVTAPTSTPPMPATTGTPMARPVGRVKAKAPAAAPAAPVAETPVDPVAETVIQALSSAIASPVPAEPAAPATPAPPVQTAPLPARPTLAPPPGARPPMAAPKRPAPRPVQAQPAQPAAPVAPEPVNQ